MVAADGVLRQPWSASLVAVMVASVLISCLPWWRYFRDAKPSFDAGREARCDAATRTEDGALVSGPKRQAGPNTPARADG